MKTKYIGEYKNGKKHGKGSLQVGNFTFFSKKLIKTVGCYEYVGQFRNDKMHGKGTLKIYGKKNVKDGAKYVGEFENGIMSGKGTLIDENELFGKHKYTGKFKNGKFNGKGKIEYSKPVKTNYVGEFYNNKMHGKGTRIAINKKKKIKMVGVFKANQMYEGHLTSDEIVFSGKWKNNAMYNGIGNLKGKKGMSVPIKIIKGKIFYK